MMPIRPALRALLVAVLAALTITVATPTPQSDALVHVYTYDGHHSTVSSTYATSERGPPAENVNLTVYNADGPRPLGARACPEGMGGPTACNYDDTRRSVQIACGSQPVERPIVHDRAKHAVDAQWRVAANAAAKVLPKTSTAFQFPGAGRSGAGVKNFVGPPNTIARGASPGRVFVTDDQGRVIFDITRDRVKPVVPGQGFISGDGRKLTPTSEQLGWIDELWGG